MRALTPFSSRLAERLRVVGEDATRAPAAADIADLKACTDALRRMVNGAGGSSGASVDRQREEARRFRNTGELPNSRAARLVSWSTTLPDGRQPPLIEEPELFPRLIDCVEDYRAHGRSYRGCWRGLLSGYVEYDPDRAKGSGRQNWITLRGWLEERLPLLDRGQRIPDWLATMENHRNLLTDNPCGRYGADILSGRDQALEALRNDLSINDSSWITRHIFDAQVDAAVGFGDADLRRVMPRILALIDEHDLYADGALARVLDRFAQCRPLIPEAGLRDLSVQRWGAPWRDRNDTSWSFVRSETREMVSSWLKLKLIEKFFRLLSEDGVNDQRRLDFWKDYVDRISDMYFALGPTARRNHSPDYTDLRKEMGERLLRLEGGGNSRNNAFIMRIGHYVFVEFGETGNAMFAFDGDAAPFDLEKDAIAGNRSALKHPDHRLWLAHSDKGSERWERKFSREIERLITGRPPSGAGSTSRSAMHGALSPPPPRSSAAPVHDLDVFLAQHQIRTNDLRSRGGAYWAHAAQTGAAAEGLRQRGFVWSKGRAAWYLKS